MVFTLGQWSCRGLSESVIARDEGPWELRQATWNLAAPYLEVVVGWRRRGDVGRTEMVLYRSISRRNASYQRAFSSVLSAREAGLVDYRLTKVHAKWTLLRCSEMAVTVMATANWNFTRRLEQVVIVEDRALHEGMLAVHDRVWENGSVERQSSTGAAFADLAEEPWTGLSTGPIR